MGTKKQSLGRLESVELRDIWNGEASDFTPWLAQEDNLSLLSDTIGMELELEAQEQNVGPFRADILCKDTASDDWVLIENQLERTDHTHLGQLLTYAAGLKAVTIIWIADHFTVEHRAALDWLNDITDDRFNFFGLEIEVWRIGESLIAPKFNLVSSPNEWTKRQPASIIEITEIKLLQQEFWQGLRNRLKECNSIVKAQAPHPQNWAMYALGSTHFHLLASVNSQSNFIQVQLVCDGPDAKPHFHLLQLDENVIKEELGIEPDWRELPNNNKSYISLRFENVDVTKREDWDRQFEWLVEKLELFHKVFSHRVKELDANDYIQEDEDQ